MGRNPHAESGVEQTRSFKNIWLGLTFGILSAIGIGVPVLLKATSNHIDLPASTDGKPELTIGFPDRLMPLGIPGYFSVEYCQFNGQKMADDILAARSQDEIQILLEEDEKCQKANAHFTFEKNVSTPDERDLLFLQVKNGQVIKTEYYDRGCPDEKLAINGIAACRIVR